MQTVYAHGGAGGGSQQKEVTDGADVDTGHKPSSMVTTNVA